MLSVLLLLSVVAPPGPAPAGASGHPSTPAYAHFYGPAGPTYFPDELPIFVLAGEPSIGINRSSGNAFFQHGFTTFRVGFDDPTLTASWTDVSPLVSEFNVDPMLYTDELTGRTFAGGLDGMCSIMAYTDDDGATWTPTGNACVATLDHQTIVSGPWANSVIPYNAVHDRAVYYCAQAQAVTCMTSFDGGLTFTQPSQVSCPAILNPGFHGSLHIGPTGTVYLPFRNCGGRVGMAVSTNNGLTWTGRQVTNSITPIGGFDPDVATTPDGTVYIGFRNGTTGGAFVSKTTTDGLFWTTPVNVGTSLGITNTTFHEMVAGDNGRAAMAFLGTTSPGNPFNAAFTGVWHLYVSHTYDGGTTWTTQQLTSDPVQRGWICASGTSCTTGRNLLDFMDTQIDGQGRVLIAYVDGCVDACAASTGTSAMSDAADPVITRQIAGKTLFAAYDGVFETLRSIPGPAVTGVVGSAASLPGRAVGGTAPYTVSWTIDSKPATSAASTSSFGSATTASTTFTPDVAGTYVLRLTVTDSATPTAATATATTTLTAIPPPAYVAPLTDPAGDALLPGTDIVEAYITAETSTTFDVVLRVPDLDQALPSTANVLGIPFGADTTYTVGWNYAESATNTVHYQVSASRYAAALPPGSPSDVFQLEVVGAGTTNWVTEVADVAGVWDATAGTITWTIPKALMVVKTAPTGASDPGVLTGGDAPVAGDTFTTFDATANTWFYALVGVGPGATRWDVATGSGSHTLTA